MKYLIYCIIVSMSLISCLSKQDGQVAQNNSPHNINQIVEVGNWVNICEAPLDCGYLSYQNNVYGVVINVPVKDVNWNLFWDRFLRPYSTASPLKHVDIPTFYISINNDEELYAKDRNYVYYPLYLDVFDYAEYYDITFEGDIRIPNADPKTFKYLGKGYAVDKNSMYYRGKKIKWNDNIILALQQDDCPEYLPIDYGMPNDD